MRLIDADVADKWMRQNNSFIDAAILKAIPTIDAVPVVRCRECKYFTPLNCYEHYCANYKGLHQMVTGEQFCSEGQRKEDDHA